MKISPVTLTPFVACVYAANPAVFQVTNFSATAQLKDAMVYHADIAYDHGHQALCGARISYYRQCSGASGVTEFDRRACTDSSSGTAGSSDDDGDAAKDGSWHWQVKRASGNHSQGGPETGYNFEFEFDAGSSSSSGARHPKLYGCKYFPESAVKCNDSVRSPYGPPAAYLDAPKSFTVPVQTTSGCLNDAVTMSPKTAPTPAL